MEMKQMTPFFHGMIDMSPRAVAGRAAHDLCTVCREAAVAAYLAAHANDDHQAQVRLDADQAGQRAYWAARKEFSA